MSFYLCKLIPPRPSFMDDMTDEERSIMMNHVAYWSNHAASGIATVFGPVADPAGGWGMAMVDVASEAHLNELITNDPASIADIGMRYETLLMPRAVIGRPKGEAAG